MFDHPAFAGHEKVLWHAHRESGLRAVVAIHDTTLGPAAGGLRRWHYPDAFAALGDVLRLSHGMTYKNALAGIPFGGGKAVLLADGPVTPAQLDAFGDLVESLAGAYVTAEDVGVTVADLRRVAERTRYVSGVSHGQGGDPSPWTARGVVAGIRTAVRFVWPGRDLAGLTVGLQGLGNVGYATAELLHDAGAHLVVADIDGAKVERAVAELGADAAGVEDIVARPMDVFAPCALGGVLTHEVAERLQARIVAGAANNQLAEPHVGEALMRRSVLYAPDYVINAGGIISVAHEYLGTADADVVPTAVDAIGPRLEEIFARAAADACPTSVEADRLAEAVIEAARSSGRGAPRRDQRCGDLR